MRELDQELRDLDQELAAIGIAGNQHPASCWRASRVSRATAPALCATSDPAQEPARSLLLIQWRRRLAQQVTPRFYRVSRIA